ncbi:hypothetical protein F4808DRAFT_439670 [Astrocystis sublimbata]|nr:hypothetical protein F4808DRAFT_439670 [Astrocystis sublimbata]
MRAGARGCVVFTGASRYLFASTLLSALAPFRWATMATFGPLPARGSAPVDRWVPQSMYLFSKHSFIEHMVMYPRYLASWQHQPCTCLAGWASSCRGTI